MGTYHFHYKHPLFGRGDWRNEPHKIKPTANGIRWDHTPYHLWFQCLLRSEGYKKFCKTKRGPYAKTYQNFGDVFAYENDFKKWFNENERGRKLFAEPYSPIQFKILTQQDGIDWENTDLCVIQFDASRHKAFVLRRVRTLINQACVQAKVTKVLSKAKIQFVSAPKDCDAYLRMLKVWDMTQQGEKTSEIHATCYPQTKRTIEQRQREASARRRNSGIDDEVDALDAKVMLQKQRSQEVRRDFKRACRLIENAAKGVFPKTT